MLVVFGGANSTLRLLNFILSSSCFVLAIHWSFFEKIQGINKIVIVTEENMFSSQDGPYILGEGVSYIKLLNHVEVMLVPLILPGGKLL